MIRVLGTKYDGSPRDEWPAQLREKRGSQLRLFVPAGTEEIVRGSRRQLIHDSFVGLFWTDRWYNIWLFDQTARVRFYANIALPCQFDGNTLRWVDLDIDIVQYADGSIVVKDEEEFEEHSVRLGYPQHVIESARAAREELFFLAQAGQFPFRR